jgi:hypothetical protein
MTASITCSQGVEKKGRAADHAECAENPKQLSASSASSAVEAYWQSTLEVSS